MEYVEGLDLQRYVKAAARCRWSRPATTSGRRRRAFSTPTRRGWCIGTSSPRTCCFSTRRPARLRRRPTPAAVGGAGRQDPRLGVARLRRPRRGRRRQRARPRRREGLADRHGRLHRAGTGQDATLVDTRADIYSLGCVLLYPADGPAAVRGAVADAEAAAASGGAAAFGATLRPGRPDELNAVLLRMMAKQPENRSDPAAGGGVRRDEFRTGNVGAFQGCLIR